MEEIRLNSNQSEWQPQPETRPDGRPTWMQIDTERDLPPGWREQWQWPAIPPDRSGRPEETYDLLEGVAHYLLRSGQPVWGDLEYLVQNGTPLDYQPIRRDDLTAIRLRRWEAQYGPTPSWLTEDPYVAIYNFGTMARNPDYDTRMTFTMRSRLIHAVIPNRLFPIISGHQHIVQPTSFAIDNKLIAQAAPSRPLPYATPDDVDTWIWPRLDPQGPIMRT